MVVGGDETVAVVAAVAAAAAAAVWWYLVATMASEYKLLHRTTFSNNFKAWGSLLSNKIKQ